MMTGPVDVLDYLARIGASAPSAPSFEALRSLHRAHLEQVPFENLDIHRGVPILLEEERILDKIVRRRRGGFCYELNYAFSWLLARLGYRVSLLSAEVWTPEGGFGIPFDHMALRVEADGESFLCDVGFGDSFLEPLRLLPGFSQTEREHDYRLSREEETWRLERRPREGGEFRPQYRFTLTPRSLEEYRGGCEYHQSSPDSPFTRKVVASRALEGGRVTLTRERLIVHDRNGRIETPIADEAAWRAALARHFDIPHLAP